MRFRARDGGLKPASSTGNIRFSRSAHIAVRVESVRMGRLTPAAIGFRVHSGWAVVVVVTGSPRAPSVLDRRRIEIADRAIQGSVQPYHFAKELGLKKAESFLKRCADSSCALAHAALHKAIDDLGGAHEVVGCGILLGSGRPMTTLEATLASHAAIHSAEGELFREALIRASEQFGLSCQGVREKELYMVAAAKFGLPSDDLHRRVNELGKSLGPPWTQDEKGAALVGWLAM